MKKLNHIAIIMDGNGRWAKKRGLPALIGHREGVETLKKIVKASIKFGIKYLTVYAFSTENWKRPEKEVRGLFRIIEHFLDNEMEIFHKNNVRLCIIGSKSNISQRLLQKIDRAEKDTAENGSLVLNVALNYGSREEIINAVKLISGKVKDGSLELSEIDEKIFSGHLYTKDCPDPDLLIRTSGETRISNFMLWQVSYAELYFTPKFWPDFREPDLKKAIEDYTDRERRFGR